MKLAFELLVAFVGRSRTLVLIGSALACSSTATPPIGVVVRMVVVNSTCSSGPCVPLRVLGFPQNQPRTPGGLWSLDLGTVTTSACLIIPPTATFRVTDAGSGATTTYTWTSADSLSLAALPSSASVLQATPTTGGFVPMSSAAWRVSLPSASLPTPIDACAS